MRCECHFHDEGLQASGTRGQVHPALLRSASTLNLRQYPVHEYEILPD